MRRRVTMRNSETMQTRTVFAAITLCVLAALLPMHAARAQNALSPPLTPERVYAALAILSKEDRAKQIEDGARREGKLVLVHTMRGSLGVRHVALFRKRYPFLELDVAGEMGSQDAAERLLTEETAGRHLTDVIITAVMDLNELLRRDFVARYPTPATSAILPIYRAFIDREHRWIPFFWSEHGISYNTSLVPPDKAPKAWKDLCDPSFRGGVSFDPAENRFLSGLHAMLGEDGTRDFLDCLGRNDPIIQRGHTQRLELMLAGDHMAQGDNYIYQGVLAKRRNPSAPFAFVTSAPILATNDVAAINRQAPHPFAAALFADWTLSQESQSYLAERLRGPVALKHPFLPDDVTLIDNTDPPPEVMNRLLGYWRHSMEKVK
jgi:iron(III) transport system substrate-binding protein